MNRFDLQAKRVEKNNGETRDRCGALFSADNGREGGHNGNREEPSRHRAGSYRMEERMEVQQRVTVTVSACGP